MPETTWPEGVIARYLTVGGATVDIAYPDFVLRAACSGERCPWKQHESVGAYYTDTPEQEQVKIDAAIPPLLRQAQSHAATCRAMPRPTV